MLLIDALAAYLSNEGFGTVGESIFLWFSPATSGTSITLSVYTGTPDAKFALDVVRLQLRVRGTDTADVTETVESLYLVLQSLSGVDLDGGWYLIDCQALQTSASYLGRDEAGRDDFVVNFELTARRPSGGHRI